jgi:hypothetical protein
MRVTVPVLVSLLAANDLLLLWLLDASTAESLLLLGATFLLVLPIALVASAVAGDDAPSRTALGRDVDDLRQRVARLEDGSDGEN